MNYRALGKIVLPIVLVMATVGCGGSGSSSSGTQDGTVDPVQQSIVTTELNATSEASLAATAADIEQKLTATDFYNQSSSVDGASAAPAASGTTYHLADVIFTLSTDNLGDVDPNTLEVNAAYNYFKTHVADAGKLSAEDLAEFRSTTIEDFNEAFVAGYYEGANEAMGAAALSAAYPGQIGLYPTQQPRRIFGFFIKMFNPFTYIKFMFDVAKTILNAILAQTFKLMLLSGTMTKKMIRLAIKFPVLTRVMISVLKSHWGITRRMIPYLKYDREFGELFTQLAYEQSNLAHFVFQNIDAPLYYGMSVSMTLSEVTTARLAEMMSWYATTYFIAPQPPTAYNNFVRLLLDTGFAVEADGQTNHGDGNELANEKLFYAMFNSPQSMGHFIGAMKQVDPTIVMALMDHIIIGQQYNPADGTLVNDDPIQGNYNIYAIAQGMLGGIEKYGFETYMQHLVDFAMLIPKERYLDYAQKMAMAAYSYYIQTLPSDATDNQKSMQAFLMMLMDQLSTLLSQVSINYQDHANAFSQMLQSLQPYIEEYMQNGMINIANAPLDQGIPDVTQINGNGIDETINDPLEIAAPHPPAPSSMIDIIEDFALLWEKDYSNGAYKGEPLSRFAYDRVWDEMSDELSRLSWVHISSTENFTFNSRFKFIFEEGSVIMYIIANTVVTPSWEFEGFSLTDTGETVSVRNVNNGNIDNFPPYRVYRVEIPAGTSLGNLHLLMNDADGIAFDISGSKPEPVVEIVTPTPPEVTDPVDENGTVVEPIEPPVTVTPSVSLDAVVRGLPSNWSERDYTNGGFATGYVYNPWGQNETWTQMPTWLSELQWMDTPTRSYFYSSDHLYFEFSAGSVDMYLTSTHANLPALVEISGLEPVATGGTPVLSTYEGMTFYVFKKTLPAGYIHEDLWLLMNNISGIAFDTRNVTP